MIEWQDQWLTHLVLFLLPSLYEAPIKQENIWFFWCQLTVFAITVWLLTIKLQLSIIDVRFLIIDFQFSIINLSLFNIVWSLFSIVYYGISAYGTDADMLWCHERRAIRGFAEGFIAVFVSLPCFHAYLQPCPYKKWFSCEGVFFNEL